MSFLDWPVRAVSRTLDSIRTSGRALRPELSPFSPLFRLRSARALLSLLSLPESASWISISAATSAHPLFAADAPGALLSGPAEDILISRVARLVINHNSTKSVPTEFRALQLSSWNVNSLNYLLTDVAQSKTQIADRILNSSVLALQETHWDQTHPNSLMQTWLVQNPDINRGKAALVESSPTAATCCEDIASDRTPQRTL